MAQTLAHTFESGQASGTTITTGNSGTGGNAFNAAAAGTGAALQYNSTVNRGSLALLATTGGTSTTSLATWNSTTITAAYTRVFGRAVMRPTALASTIFQRGRGGGTQNYRLRLNANGTITLLDTTSSVLVSSVGAQTTSDWWLIRWDITIGASATGVFYVHHNPTVATPDETLTANNANFATANCDEATWGIVIAGTNLGVRLDDIVFTDVALPGPPSQSISISETATVAESVASSLALPRSAAETLTAAESVARTLALPRAAAETLTAGETVTRSLLVARSMAEAMSLAENVDRVLALPRSLAETLTAAETIGAQPSIGRALTDTLAITETIDGSLLQPRTVGETVTIAEDITADLSSAPTGPAARGAVALLDNPPATALPYTPARALPSRSVVTLP